MYFNKIVLIAAFSLYTQLSLADGLSAFDKAAAAALGVATKSAGKAVELDSEQRALADPEHALEIRSNAQLGLDVLHKTDETLFDAAGVDVNSFASTKEKKSTFELGIYGQMLRANNANNNIALYSLPSKRWLDLQGFDINKAVGLRIPQSIASKMIANENGQSFKSVITNDIKNLRDALIKAGADDALLKSSIIQVIDLSNVVYADRLVKPKQ